jgi:hypothetical protein
LLFGHVVFVRLKSLKNSLILIMINQFKFLGP